MEKEIKKKMWAVVWTKEAAWLYGAEPYSFISVEPDVNIRTKSRKKSNKGGFYWAEPVAIFERKQEAVAFRDGNTDWAVVPCFVSLTPTLHA